MGNCIGLSQAAILKRMELVERQGDQLELERLTRAKQIQDEITSDSIDQLTSVLKQGDPIPNSGDPLMTCLSCIGKQINLEFVPPRKSEDLNRVNYVEAVCRASKVRYRNVKLRYKWWKHDNGPLLVFLKRSSKADNPVELQPAVLLPAAGGLFGKNIFDPQ